jgi:hypothetical protein
VTGDTQQRIIVGADGRILLGNGASVADVTVQRIGVGIWGALETRLRATGASAATLTYDTLVTGDAVQRWTMGADGKMSWGSGAGAVDSVLERAATAIMRFTETRVRASAAVAGSLTYDSLVTGDAVQRWTMGADGAMSWGAGSGAVDVVLSRTAANILSLAAGDSYAVAGTQVVTTRQTGWTVATGTPSRATFTTSGVTLATLAGVVMALEQDLITHGLIGA